MTQFNRKDESELRWIQVLPGSEPQEILVDLEGTYRPTTSTFVLEGLVLFQSVLEISNVAPPDGTHTYWCELFTVNEEADEDIKGCNVPVNRLTVYEPDIYIGYPLCSEDTIITERVCACVDRNSSSTDSAPCSSTDNCDNTGTSCNNSTAGEDSSVINVVIVGAVIGSVVVVLLVVVILELVVCCICMKKKKRRDEKHKASIKSKTKQYVLLFGTTKA